MREKLDGEQSNKNEICSIRNSPHEPLQSVFWSLPCTKYFPSRPAAISDSRGQWLIPDFHLPALLSIHTCSDVISAKGQRCRQKNRMHSIPRSPGRYILYNFIIILITLLPHSPWLVTPPTLKTNCFLMNLTNPSSSIVWPNWNIPEE